MTSDDAERNDLMATMVELQQRYETTTLQAFLGPLLDLDLTIQQLRVLALLVASENGSTGQSIARQLGVSLATVSGIVDRIEAHDMAERHLDDTDQRVRRIHATASGRELIRTLSISPGELGLNVLRKLDVEDLRALVRGFGAVMNLIPGFDSKTERQ